MIKVIRSHKGLGDSVAYISDKLGVSYAVNKIAESVGVPCGCEGRKEKLNKLVPYARKK